MPEWGILLPVSRGCRLKNGSTPGYFPLTPPGVRKYAGPKCRHGHLLPPAVWSFKPLPLIYLRGMSGKKVPAIGIIGGTGREGSALALRLAQAGFSVAIGSRSEQRAAAKAHELATALRSVGLSPTITGEANAQVVQTSDVIFLSVPFPHVLDTVPELSLRPSMVVVDTTVPVRFERGKAEFVEVAGGSVSEQLQARIPDVHLVAAFKTIPARILNDIDTDLDCDAFVASDSEEAKRTVMTLAARVSGLRPVDAGPLQTARALERMAGFAIDINLRHKIKSARFRIVGL